jgi:hypothetical protein
MSSAYWLLRILWDINNDADNDDEDDHDGDDDDDDDSCSVVRLDILVSLDIGCIILSTILGNDRVQYNFVQ